MQSRWKDADARRAISVYGALGAGEGLALRAYTTRLLGREPRAGAARRRQHLAEDRDGGPGRRDARGAVRQGLGPGHGRPSTRRASPPSSSRPLRKLRARDDLSDEDMVRVQRAYLLDPLAPDPSVEILLHAFMPHKYVDHTHANAVLSPDRPAQRRGAGPRGLRRRAWGSCPTTAPASASPSKAAGCPRRQARGRGPDPRQARHLHLRRHARARPTSA